MTAEEFKQEIYNWMPNKPKNWREGQAVFNYIDEVYGVARTVQFHENVDCFYDDSKIDVFIETCAKIITKRYEPIQED
jgi:hypothetical protein